MTTNSDQTTLRYSHDHVFAAMCIWEEICSTTMPEAGEPWEPFREQHGACELRELVIRNLASQCDAAWSRAWQAYELADAHWRDNNPGGTDNWANPSRPDEPGPFDWGFVPTWLRVGVDWSDLLNGPRVLGS